MNRKTLSLITLGIIFVIVLIPSLHVPMLSDDFYYAIMGGHPLSQYQHYMSWSGRIVTNMLSSYMMTYLPHSMYAGLTAAAFVLMLFLISCLPSALTEKKIRCSWITLSIIFIFYWIANPTLGQTSFWFVGAANYLWTVLFVSFYLIMVAKTETKPKLPNIIFAFVVGFLAGCSNENTCIVVLLITIGYTIYAKKCAVIYPYLIGLVTGAAVLLLSLGSAARSKHFVDWHSMPLIGQIDLQLFTRMPEAMQEFWQVYLLIIVLALATSIFDSKAKSDIVCATVFFVAAILCNLAFIASPFMPHRAYNGALFMMLISVSFLMNAFLQVDNKKGIYSILSMVYVFCLVYFVPSYAFFTTAGINIWAQDKIRHRMILEQVKEGKKEVIIPDYYFTRLAKSTDEYPSYKQPKMATYYGVDSITELPVKFDYSLLKQINHVEVNSELTEGVVLKSIYLYQEPFRGSQKIIYRISGDINSLFKKGDAIFSHVMLNGKDEFLNKDTANEAVKIGNDWYTYSDALDIKFEEVKSINIGIYQINPLKTLSQINVDF